MNKLLFFTFLACLLPVSTATAETILLEDFEDTAVSYTTSIAEFTDGAEDYFTRTDGNNISGSVELNTIQGTHYFAAQDVDLTNNSGTNPVTMSFSGINITGYTNLVFSAYFAEDDNGASQSWDSTDFFLAEYQIDGGGFQNLLAFENDGSRSNSAPFLDTNFDGVGDGGELTDTFSLFSSTIIGVGNTLDMRFTFSLNAGNEDIALDNVQISGVAPVPEPKAYAMLLLGLTVLGFFTRKSKLSAF